MLTYWYHKRDRESNPDLSDKMTLRKPLNYALEFNDRFAWELLYKQFIYYNASDFPVQTARKATRQSRGRTIYP